MRPLHGNPGMLGRAGAACDETMAADGSARTDEVARVVLHQALPIIVGFNVLHEAAIHLLRHGC